MTTKNKEKLFTTRLNAELAAKLEFFAKERNTTPYMILRELVQEQLDGIELPETPPPGKSPPRPPLPPKAKSVLDVFKEPITEEDNVAEALLRELGGNSV